MTSTSANPVCKKVTCPQPRPLSDGFVAIVESAERTAATKIDEQTVEYGAVAIYSCERKFTLRGVKELVCGDGGKWEAEAPR